MGCFYPIQDPLENLRIKVTLERINTVAASMPNLAVGLGASLDEGRRRPGHQRSSSAASSHSGPSQAGPAPLAPRSNVTVAVVGWQQKLFSAREARLYADPAAFTDPLHRAYAEELRGSTPPTVTRVFTYTQGDLALREAEAGGGGQEGEGGAGRETKPRNARVGPAEGRLGSRLVADSPTEELRRANRSHAHALTTMRIMAYVGPENSETAEDEADERVLATVRLLNGNRLQISPDFNASLYRAHRVEGKIGIFHYRLEQVRPAGAERSRAGALRRERQLSAGLAGLSLGDMSVPEDGVLKLLSLPRIDVGWGFEYDGLGIEWCVGLPKGWYAADPASLHGFTHFSERRVVDGEEVHVWSWPLELCLCHRELYPYRGAEGPLEWPWLGIAVWSEDSWGRVRAEGYGWAALPMEVGQATVDVRTWRIVDSKAPIAALRRFLIGADPQLASLDSLGFKASQEPVLKLTDDGVQELRPEGSSAARETRTREGLDTASSGTVRVTFATLQQSRGLIGEEKERQLRYGSLLEKIGAKGLHVSILRVLEAFQKARQRMLAARQSLLPT